MYAADAAHPNATLEGKLQALYTLNRDKTVDLGFRPPYLQLLEALGNPHLSLPPVIHVAGTNGKGSVIAMLRAVFEAAGYKVHAYTSPHLAKFNERIYLAGQDIEDDALEALLDEVVALNESRAVTFFEITTALAFAAFSRTPADILLLEVGLGGRLDCTNIIENPLATAITAIGYDHMEYLGETLPEIAAEKAGIMKPGAPCVIGPQADESVFPVFEGRAKELDIPLVYAAREWDAAMPVPNLAGPHQVGNANTALAVLNILEGFDSPEGAIRQGLQSIRWPGRLQQIKQGSLYDLLPDGWELWLDGGHNEGAGRVLAEQAKSWEQTDGKPLHLIVGMMNTKDPQAFLAPLLPHAASLAAIPIPDEPQSFSPAEIVAAAGSGIPAENIEDAIRQCQKANGEAAGRILICGSLYLTGSLINYEK